MQAKPQSFASMKNFHNEFPNGCVEQWAVNIVYDKMPSYTHLTGIAMCARRTRREKRIERWIERRYIHQTNPYCFVWLEIKSRRSQRFASILLIYLIPKALSNMINSNYSIFHMCKWWLFSCVGNDVITSIHNFSRLNWMGAVQCAYVLVVAEVSFCSCILRVRSCLLFAPRCDTFSRIRFSLVHKVKTQQAPKQQQVIVEPNVCVGQI